MGNKPESSRRPRTNPKTLKGQEDLQNSGCMNPRSPEDEGNTIKKKKKKKKPRRPRTKPQVFGNYGTKTPDPRKMRNTPGGPGTNPKNPLGTETTGRRAWRMEDGEITLSWT